MQYLDYAFNLGLIHHFAGLEKGSPLFLTIRGREYTTHFEFVVGGQKVTAESVQIEVDAGYEGASDLILCEAKIGQPTHFNIRQLYYPFRHFSQIAPSKEIRPLLFTYDIHKGTYTFYEFTFTDKKVFNSIKLKLCFSYIIATDTDAPVTLTSLFDPSLETANNIVPQADDFNKIIELVSAVHTGLTTPAQLAEHFTFTERQAHYYREAAEFLGLISRDPDGELSLTNKGTLLANAPPAEQGKILAKLVVNSWLFQELFERARRKGYFTRDDISDLIASVLQGGKPRYSGSTVERRRQTIEAWLKWLHEQFECLAYDSGKYLPKW